MFSMVTKWLVTKWLVTKWLAPWSRSGWHPAGHEVAGTPPGVNFKSLHALGIGALLSVVTIPIQLWWYSDDSLERRNLGALIAFSVLSALALLAFVTALVKHLLQKRARANEPPDDWTMK